MKKGYLIYHPKRETTNLGDIKVFHDKFGGNEDPYIWNEKFLYTYCHITQLTNEIGQVNFWVSADKYREFNQLFCDCVFVIAEKHFWSEQNSIKPDDVIVDNIQTFEHHYKWAEKGHHRYKKRSRYTLKANPNLSFQPQDVNSCLIDIMPFLNQNAISKNELLKSMTSKKGSRPFKLPDDLTEELYRYIYSVAEIKIFGKDLDNKHPNLSLNSNFDCKC
jgi:hypothetical protein